MPFVAPLLGRRAVALALFGLLAPACTAFAGGPAWARAESGAASDVRTIAGSGAAGLRDGAAQAASFLMPSGLAFGPDGTLYIADEAAQRVRALSAGGAVRTVAGSGDIEAPGLSVRGGFRDGPALQARFNQPQGLAFGPDGALYVADSANACVRKLANGVVSTAAGRCGAPGHADGSAADARLNDPRALAFDGNGSLYIADFDSGLRRLARDGTLATIHFQSTAETRILGVALSPGANPTVLATAPTLLIEYHPESGSDTVTSIDVAEGGTPFGSPFQVVGRDARQFFFSDLRTDAVSYLRLAAKPFVTTVFTRALAGHAQFYAPQALALRGQTLYVADAGSRRVRALALPATRISEAGLSGAVRPDLRHRELAYVGASWTFWDSLGDDSLCAGLERGVAAAGKAPKPLRCHAVRIDAAGLPQMENYVDNVLADENFDDIVLNLTFPAVDALFPDHSPPSADALASAFRSHVKALLAVLRPHHTALAIVWSYEADDVSSAEDAYERALQERRAQPDKLHASRPAFLRVKAALAGLPVRQYDSYADTLAYERTAGALPLYGGDDSHLRANGNAFLAARIAHFLTAKP